MKTRNSTSVQQETVSVQQETESVTVTRIHWSSEDKRLFEASFRVWEDIESDYTDSEIKEIEGKVNNTFNRKDNSNASCADRCVSAIIFNYLIDPTKIYACFKNKELKSIGQKNAWKKIINLFDKGHEFGATKNKIKFDSNPDLKNKFIEKANELGIKNLGESTRKPKEKKSKEVSTSDDEKSQVQQRENSPFIEDRPIRTTPKRKIIFDDIENDSPSPKENKTAEEVNETPTILTEKNVSVVPSVQNYNPLDNSSLIIKIINTRLNVCKGDVSQINFEWIAFGNKESAEKARSIWEQYLIENNPCKNSDEDLMFLVEYSLTVSKDIDWNWVSEGMKTSAEKCRTEWQQQVYNALKNKN